jgi:hypothetical protein
MSLLAPVVQKKSSNFLTRKYNKTKAQKAKGEVREYLPLLLRHMRRNKIEFYTSKEFGEDDACIVIWLQEEWPRIFIHPEIERSTESKDFAIMYYDLSGDRCIYDTREALWFAPRVVEKQRKLLDSYIESLN